MHKRCYLRGLTPLGLLNTVLGCLFNRVIVRVTDTTTGSTLRLVWGKATDHPQSRSVQDRAVPHRRG
jgi:hypothetical protein